MRCTQKRRILFSPRTYARLAKSLHGVVSCTCALPEWNAISTLTSSTQHIFPSRRRAVIRVASCWSKPLRVTGDSRPVCFHSIYCSSQMGRAACIISRPIKTAKRAETTVVSTPTLEYRLQHFWCFFFRPETSQRA